MNGPCEEYADRIVDYVDGELPGDEARAVAAHLAECDRCRQTVEAMERSVRLAKVVWSANLADSESAIRGMPTVKRRRVRFYAVAAGILIAVSTLTLVIPHRRSPSPSPFEEVERQVNQAGAAARLLAATQLLAQCEGMESVVKEQRRYILDNYAETPAAAMLGDSNHLGRDSK